MQDRRIHGWLLLGLLALSAAMPLLLADTCADGCPPTCGDCAACGLVADQCALPALPVRVASGTSTPAPAASPTSVAPRQLDHVPLRALA